MHWRGTSRAIVLYFVMLPKAKRETPAYSQITRIMDELQNKLQSQSSVKISADTINRVLVDGEQVDFLTSDDGDLSI